MRLFLFVIISAALLLQSTAFALPLQAKTSSRSSTTLQSASGHGSTVSLVAAGKAALSTTKKAAMVVKRAGAAAAPVAAASVNDLVAKILGYVLGAGSMLVYTPIILSLVKAKNADGFSVMTWVFNLLGLAVALIYPFKKAFPLSTYIEILILTVQSAGILGLVCFYRDLFKEYLLGMGAFALVAGAVAVAQVRAGCVSLCTSWRVGARCILI